MHKRTLLSVVCICLTSLLALNTYAEDTKWIEGRELTICGKNTNIASKKYCRLPISLVNDDPDLKSVGDLSSGISIRFKTNAETISIRWQIHKQEPLDHLTPCAANCFDLYARPSSNQWIWVGNTMQQDEKGSCSLVIGGDGKMCDYELFLPLNAVVDSVFIGVNESAYLMTIQPNEHAPIVLFGSDRSQGFSASRSGLSTSALLSRATNKEVINMGLGNLANFDEIMADILVTTKPSAIVVDCNNNLTSKSIIERSIPFFDQIATVHSEIPIILVEQALPMKNAYNQAEYAEIKARNTALERAYKMLVASGLKNIYYMSAMAYKTNDVSIDGIHFNDVGLKEYVERLADFLSKISVKK
ncbi:MAG: SGNH/GDSL hydrolase family protein [Bacteroidales bacterium]|nr:SGNH/GDSL hydrolase family protein [Bacteroidales bacterium]